MAAVSRVPVASPADVERARREARALARAVGLGVADAEVVALATTELATNLLRYAWGGRILLARVDGPRGTGVQVASRDRGPGIADLERAMADGYSTGGGLGDGLPSVRRLMDEFAISSRPTGTRVVARKWPSRR